jgi:hypothetical protein
MATRDPIAASQLGRYYGGALPSPYDHRDYLYAGQHPRAVSPNQDVSRWDDGQIWDQGREGSCTAWSLTDAAAAAWRKARAEQGLATDIPERLSAALQYYNARKFVEKTFPQDSGCTMRGAAQALATYGDCYESLWPYDPSGAQVGATPPKAAVTSAPSHKLITYLRIDGTGPTLLNGMLSAMQDGWPVWIAFDVWESYEEVGADGLIPMPGSGERKLGGHANTLWSAAADNSFAGGGSFDDKNQWGLRWGKQGRARMPFGYVLNGIVGEAWIIKAFTFADLVDPTPAPPPPVVIDLRTAVREKTQQIRTMVGRAQTDRCAYGATLTQYRTSMATIMDHDVGPFKDVADQIDAIVDAPDPSPAPPPATSFVLPVPNGGVFGKTKWLGGSKGCDIFLPRGTRIKAPADCVLEEIVGGTGLSGGAEGILALATKTWAWRWRHVRVLSGFQVGDVVRQGQEVAEIGDESLDQLGRIPAWAGTMPDGWQHLDLSVNQHTDQFSPTGGGGGNYSAYQWLVEYGYAGRVLERTPGPPDAGMSLQEAIERMTPAGRR